MSDSLKDPDTIPFLNACTIMVSSLVFSLTTCAPKMVEEFILGLSLILSYVKEIVRNGWRARFAMYCYLNSLVSCENDVTWPSGRLMNQSITNPTSVLMNCLHRTASEPPTNIICVWKAVR